MSVDFMTCELELRHSNTIIRVSLVLILIYAPTRSDCESQRQVGREELRSVKITRTGRTGKDLFKFAISIHFPRDEARWIGLFIVPLYPLCPHPPPLLCLYALQLNIFLY